MYEYERDAVLSVRPEIFFDVGANVGDVSRIAVELGVPDVHAFEPQPACQSALRELPITVVQSAVGREAGDAILYQAVLDESPDLLSSLRRRRLGHYGIDHGVREILVPVLTLDEYCFWAGVERIDLLKIDVEGHEADVLRGAATLLAEGRVGAVVAECYGVWEFSDGYEPSTDEVVSLLAAGGLETRVDGSMLLATRSGTVW